MESALRADSRAAVVAATQAELIENGWAGLSAERVAQRAGLADSAVSERWPDVEALAAELLRRFFARRTARAAEPVVRAIAAGQLPPETDPVEVIRALGAPFYYRMFVTREPLDDALAERAAAAALAAARAGVLTSG